MLEAIMERQIIFYIVGGIAALGIIAKLISGISMKRLVRAAGNMSKSTHALMRLIRAKFEHACMVSDRVQNVSAFVDKYMYEYKVCGIRLHSWRQLQKGLVWICGILTVLGMSVEYYYQGMWINFYNYVLVGGITTGFLLLLYLSTDEKYQMNVAKTYMVDFLENTYAHRYEKNQQKEIQVTVQRAETDVENQVVRDEREENYKERFEERTQPKNQKMIEKYENVSEEVGDREDRYASGKRSLHIRRGVPSQEEAKQYQRQPVQKSSERLHGQEAQENIERFHKQPVQESSQRVQETAVQGEMRQPQRQEFRNVSAGAVDEPREEGMKEAKIREILEEFLA